MRRFILFLLIISLFLPITVSALDEQPVPMEVPSLIQSVTQSSSQSPWDFEPWDSAVSEINETAIYEKLPKMELNAPTAILVEADSGEILYEKTPHIKLAPASVTKIMTLLLIMEALGRGDITLDDVLTVSDTASKMTGSRVFLSRGEKISVNEILKSIAVSSGNDACVCIAEYMAGSEESFVAKMNQRAKELKMKETNFANSTGLPAENHYTTAYDITIMARELMKYKKIFEYTTIWIDYLRDGKFMLSNTNKLIRFYDGANGLKTGSTTDAGYCLAATAMRNNMQLIGVVLGANTSDIRFEIARKLLDYGFANYTVTKESSDTKFDGIRVLKGHSDTVPIAMKNDISIVSVKGKEKEIERTQNVVPDLMAPVEKGQKVGEIVYSLNGHEVGKCDLVTTKEVKRMTYFDNMGNMMRQILMIKNK